MAALNGYGKQPRRTVSQDDVAYEYLCRLEEAKKWIESVIGEELPPVLELEDALQNGVYLCKLGMAVLPHDDLWKKVYDLDQSKFKERGLDYRYTDNINFWLKSLCKLGLPKVFYPVMTDIYHKKDMPKLVYCLHALSHLMKRKGYVSKAVADLFGSAKFSHDAVVQTGQNLNTLNYNEMPAFGVVGNLVEEELQYQSMGLHDSYEDEVSHSLLAPKKILDVRKLFDDPTYISNKPLNVRVGMDLVELPCVNNGVKVTLYSYVEKARRSASPVVHLLNDFNQQLSAGDPEGTFRTMKEVVKLVDSNVFLFHPYAERYLHALRQEQKNGIPMCVMPVYSGMDRNFCETILENLSPGGYIVRSSNTIQGAFVISFRNNTGIKHWKISTKNGKFFWGTSPLFSTIDTFIEHFSEELSEATKLHVYFGMASSLQPVVQTVEHQKIMSTIHDTDEYLTYGPMTKVIRDVNTEVRKEKKLLHTEQQSGTIPNSCETTWDTSMIVKVKKVEAEKILNSKGVKGSFLVRPSERTKGDYALAFRTHTDIRHWRILCKGDSYYVHPRPNPYNSMDDIITHFQEAVSQETGLAMIPLQFSPPSSPPITFSKDRDMMEGSMELMECGSGKPPGVLPVPTHQNSPLACAPSRSMSRLNPANLTSWSIDDVCFWVISHGFGNFVDTFRDNEVDGECLLTLDNKLLRDDLGITALGQRSRLLKRVESLKKEIHPN